MISKIKMMVLMLMYIYYVHVGTLYPTHKY